MKAHFSRLLPLALMLLLTSGLPACATTKDSTARAYSVRYAERNSSLSVVRGKSPREVEVALGVPQRKLSADVWAYSNFGAREVGHGADDCTTLIVSFVEGRVSDLQLVNAHAEAIYAARLQPKPENRLQVAAK